MVLRRCDSDCDVNGRVTIGYAVHNEATATSWTVFVAGVCAARGMWDRQVAALPPTTGAVCIDNRGIGDSDTPKRGYSTDAMAADATAVLREVFHGAPPKLHVVGHSLGAMIACKLASTLAADGALASLALLSGSLGGFRALVPPITPKLVRTLPKLATANTAHRRASADLDCHFTDAYVEKHRDELMAEYVALSESSGRFEGAGKERADTGEQGHIYAVLRHNFTRADLASIRESGARVVVAHGARDGVADPRAGRRLWRAFDAAGVDAHFVPLDGAHFVTRECADAVDALLAAQVDGTPVAGAAAPDPPADLSALACLALLLAVVGVGLLVAFAAPAKRALLPDLDGPISPAAVFGSALNATLGLANATDPAPAAVFVVGRRAAASALSGLTA